MSKYKKKPPSSESIDMSLKIARGIQKPGQTKEQTKLISQGIQKGIAEYKKQQKTKAHEQEKLKKKKCHQQQTPIESSQQKNAQCKLSWLPWTLLLLSWLGMAIYILIYEVY